MEKNQTSCPKAVCEKFFRAITFGPAFSTIRRISSRQQTPSSATYARNPSLPNFDPPTGPFDIKTASASSQRPKPTSKEGSEVPIKFDYTTPLPTPPTEKPKPTAQNNGHVPLARKAEQAKKLKPSTGIVQSGKPVVQGNGQQAHNKSKPMAEKTNGQIQVQVDHQANKEEGKKPTQYYDDSFSAFINQTRRRITSHDQDSGENPSKPVGHSHGHGHRGIGKDHHFSNFIDQTKRKIRTNWSIKDRSTSFFK